MSQSENIKFDFQNAEFLEGLDLYHPGLHQNQNSQIQSMDDNNYGDLDLSTQNSSNIELEKITPETEETENEKNEALKQRRQKKNLKLNFRKNTRRKNNQKEILRKLVILAQNSTSNSSLAEKLKLKDMNLAQLTKNLLAFAKKPHFDFIKKKKGTKFIESLFWLNDIAKKDGINIEDYDLMYKSPALEGVLSQFFEAKVLYRDLTLSRTIQSNRIFYLYFMDIFEKNFLKGSFKGISQTKLQIQSNNYIPGQLLSSSNHF